MQRPRPHIRRLDTANIRAEYPREIRLYNLAVRRTRNVVVRCATFVPEMTSVVGGDSTLHSLEVCGLVD